MITIIGGLLFFLVVIIGPLPLCLSLLHALDRGVDRGLDRELNRELDREKEKNGFSHNLIVVFSFWCISQIVFGLLLGLIHCFNPSTLLAAEIVFFLAGLFVLNRANGNKGRSWKSSVAFGRFFKLPFDINPFEVFILGILVFFGVVLIWRIFTAPITSFDSLTYHLPAIAEWKQAASFTSLDRFGHIGYYPYSWEVLCALFVFPFDSDFTVLFPNIIAWLLLGLCIYRIALSAGIRRILCLTAASLVMSMPIVLKNVLTLHIDLPFAAFFLVSIYYCISIFKMRNRSRRAYYIALFFTSLGMLMGIKTSGLLYGFLSLIIFLVLMLKTKFVDKDSFRFSFKTYAVFISGGLLFLFTGGFWYLKNYFELGNPIGPISVKLGGVILFPGKIEWSHFSNTSLLSIFQPTDISHWKMVVMQMATQLGVGFFAIVLFAMSLPLFWRKTTGREQKTSHLVLAGIIGMLISTCILYLATPYSASNYGLGLEIHSWFLGQGLRYAIPFLCFLGITAAFGSQLIDVHDTVWAVIVLISGTFALSRLGIFTGYLPLFAIVFLLVSWEWISMKRVSGKWSGLNNIGVIIKFNSALKKIGPVSVMITILFFIMVSVFFHASLRRNANRIKAYGEASHFINQMREDECIGYISSHNQYLLYGKNLNRRIKSVSAKDRVETISQWVWFLEQAGIRFIALGPLTSKNAWDKKEIRWLRKKNGPFVPVVGGPPEKSLTIYSLTGNRIGPK